MEERGCNMDANRLSSGYSNHHSSLCSAPVGGRAAAAAAAVGLVARARTAGLHYFFTCRSTAYCGFVRDRS